MIHVIDQLGKTIIIESDKPKRIISLVPSQTEFLWEIGIREELIGITKFCVHPKEMYNVKFKVGGTKKLNISKIIELKPDLIIGNKEENTKSEIEYLSELFPVWISDVRDLESAYEMMIKLGEILNKSAETKLLLENIKNSLELIPVLKKPKKIAYLIWEEPLMAVGTNNFIQALLNKCGFDNIFSNKIERYPKIDLKDLVNSCPDVIFLSSEPYPFKQKHLEYYQKLLPKSSIKLVDGELFSWYGSRLKYTSAYLQKTLASIT